MLAIRLTAQKRKAMVRTHTKHMLKIIKVRLARPENSFLLYYFKTDESIREVLEVGADSLLVLNERVIKFLTSLYTKKDILKALKRTFSETYFFKKATPIYNAYHLCDKLGLKTCPYCNILPIPTVVKRIGKEKIVRPALDHFFASSSYPMLAISFYNLVPGCDICNGRFKLAKNTHHLTHLNPHSGEFGDDFVFRLGGFNEIDDVLSNKAPRFNVKLKNLTKDIRFDGNEKLFHLNTMYALHKDSARSCLVKSRTYSPAMVESIKNVAKSSGSSGYFHLFDANFEIERLHEHPLSKLKRDIVAKYASDSLKTKLGL